MSGRTGLCGVQGLREPICDWKACSDSLSGEVWEGPLEEGGRVTGPTGSCKMVSDPHVHQHCFNTGLKSWTHFGGTRPRSGPS